MATIKSFTSLEQSRKLAKILPLESADMVYQSVEDEYGDGKWESIPRNNSLNIGYDDDIPCWSLASLLGVLPKNLNIGRPSLASNYMGYYWIQYYDEYMKPNNYKTKCLSNPVDACVEMIFQLKENELI